MTSRWIAALRALFAAPDTHRTTRRTRRDVARFGIGFCPGCKRLRSAASLRCDYCGSLRPVAADA
jgi:hypothetical protein